MRARADQIRRETRYLRDFQRQADEISRLIVSSDLPWVDIEIEISKLRREAERLFPLKMKLFEAIFVRRFYRLREQWRPDEV
jgi:hypothetical protein